jgi:hypothetical protein
MGDELINLEFAGHVSVNKLAHLCATLDTTKGTAFPYTTSHKLESCQPPLASIDMLNVRRPTSCGYFLASGSDTHDDTFTPSVQS